MSEHLTLDESTEAGEPPVISKSFTITFARYVSIILSPLGIALPLILLVAYYRERSSMTAVGYTCLTLLFLVIGPTIYIVHGVRRGKFSDVDLSRRTERSGPFLFSIGSAAFGLVALMSINAPKNLQTLVMIMIICGLLMMMITLWWKISIHTSSLASALTVLTMLYGNIVIPAFALIALVSWSRVVLRRHTVAQVIAGTIVGIALPALILIVRGI